MRRILLPLMIAACATMNQKPDSPPVQAPQPQAKQPTTLFSKWKGGSCTLDGKFLTIKRDGYDASIHISIPPSKFAKVIGRSIGGSKRAISLVLPVSKQDYQKEPNGIQCTEEQVAVLFPDRVDFYGPPKDLIEPPKFFTVSLILESFEKMRCGQFIDTVPTLATVDDSGNLRVISFSSHSMALPVRYGAEYVKPVTTCSITQENNGTVTVSVPELGRNYTLTYDEGESTWNVIQR